tara:strand:+ start:1146 stop:1862 length:717 start_codon:yes stop_codon:yes gene_type:complete
MGLIMHAGGRTVDINDVCRVETPHPTATHFPISHRRVVKQVDLQLKASGLEVAGWQHGLWGDKGQRYFGLAEIAGQDTDARTVVGVRNSHDKRFSAQISLGNQVMVCDNLSFFGDVVLSRKHTRFVSRDLSGLVGRAVGRLAVLAAAQQAQIERYKTLELDDRDFHDLAIRSVDNKVISASKLPKLLNEWRHSEHEEFHPRTAWSAFNGFTEVMKGSSQETLSLRTQKLHNLLYTEVA